ncbi:hypothetical protein FOPE_00302 [Fonsecaea pedrosoi]|nr:hypothetical protein FOPE_00302 [Fonsecaea pedrosoi]
MTILRSQNTEGKDFIDAFAKVAAQLMARALDFIPVECQQVTTPTGGTYQGVRQAKQVCGISILRAGASLEDALRTAYKLGQQHILPFPSSPPSHQRGGEGESVYPC